jgi:hypothetical protein
MSRLEVPLQHRTLRTTGDTVLWAELALSLKRVRGGWEELTFRVDSGTEMMTVPAFTAKLRLAVFTSRPLGAQPRHRDGVIRAILAETR